MEEIKIVRVYLHEQEHLLKEIMNYLQGEANIRGVTIFRGIGGFGTSGALHSSAIVDLSLDLPVVVEFFDATPTIEKTLSHLKTVVKPQHIISWPAICH